MLGKRTPKIGEETEAIIEAMDASETDRGCALIGSSIAERALKQIIELHAHNVPKNKLDELFGGEAPLANFSARITIAYAFGMIDGNIRSDFDRVREIRNAFAHSMIHVTFKTPAVAHACAGFLAPASFISKEHMASEYPARRAYLNAVLTLMHAATLTKQRSSRGHTKKLMQPLNYDEVAASLDKLLKRSLRRPR